MSANSFRLLILSATAAIAACSAQGKPTAADVHGAIDDHGSSAGHASNKHGEQAHADDAHAPSPAADHGTKKSKKKAHHGPAHWSYEGDDGPSHWAELSHDFLACSTGRMQSPIDLSTANAAGDVMLQTDYKYNPVHVADNGHTIQVDTTGGQTLTNGKDRYHLAQFHFHTPSEHTLNGKHFPMEMHLVHKNQHGELLVLGVLFQEGPANEHISEVIGSLSTDDAQLNPTWFLPDDPHVYRYQGSLTTPPCSEGVNWHVMRKPVTASPTQIKAFQQIMGENARPIQALNHRLVVRPL